MNNRSTQSYIYRSSVQQNPRRKTFQILVLLSLCSIMFLRCSKDDDVDLDPVYGPTVEMQFGAESALVQEISFNSQKFSIVGDLRLPVEGSVHPLIIMVHGSGEATRSGAVPFEPLIEVFLRNGFGVLSWDKPGSGSSKGEFTNGYTITERAKILVDAMQVMIENASIDNSSIGLWGISQAGWVMPKALDTRSDFDFMIVVSGGGEDGIEQFAYQVSQVAACAGASPETVQNAEKYWAQMAKATNYSQYKEAADILATIPSVVDYTGFKVLQENEWNAWPQDSDAFFDPMDIMRKVTIPVLAFFGELDKNIDPVQGAQAYQTALEEAGNMDYRIEVIQSVGHILTPAQTGCINEAVSGNYVTRYLQILEGWISNRN